MEAPSAIAFVVNNFNNFKCFHSILSILLAEMATHIKLRRNSCALPLYNSSFNRGAFYMKLSVYKQFPGVIYFPSFLFRIREMNIKDNIPLPSLGGKSFSTIQYRRLASTQYKVNYINFLTEAP